MAAILAVPTLCMVLLRLHDASAVFPRVALHICLFPKETQSFFNFISPIFQQKFRFDESFLIQLHRAVVAAPVNSRTGRSELMFTIFDAQQLLLARNCLCSSRSVGLPDDYHIFIALDEISLSGLSLMHTSTLFLNLSGRGFGYFEFCRAKLFVQALLLFWGVEATMCDNDLVFLRDPRELFREESDFEAMVQNPEELTFSPSYPWWRVNVGFMRCLPSELGIVVYRQWLERMLSDMTVLDQNFLQRMLQSSFVFATNSTAWFNLSKDTSRNELFALRYYDPLHVQNGAMMTRFRSEFTELARTRHVREPYACHLAYIVPQKKIRVFVESGLWFLSPGNDTCGVRPAKHIYDPWKL
jgi:hypothetical protein